MEPGEESPHPDSRIMESASAPVQGTAKEPARSENESADDREGHAHLPPPPHLPQETPNDSECSSLHLYHTASATAEQPLVDTVQAEPNISLNTTDIPSSCRGDDISGTATNNSNVDSPCSPCRPHEFSGKVLNSLGHGSYGMVHRVVCSKCNEVITTPLPLPTTQRI